MIIVMCKDTHNWSTNDSVSPSSTTLPTVNSWIEVYLNQLQQPGAIDESVDEDEQLRSSSHDGARETSLNRPGMLVCIFR